MASLKVDFVGGIETLFHGRRQLSIPLLSHDTIKTVAQLIILLRDKYFDTAQRLDLFLDPATMTSQEASNVRAGILILINDVDWELEGGLEASLSAGDVITFISTLHGG